MTVNSATLSGAILSARHSFMPNRLGYCGPDENQVLLNACLDNKPNKALIQALQGFQGAYPYHRFIAETTGIEDPFDYRVAEAYWIGNDLLERIPPDGFYQHLRMRLSAKFPREHVKKFFQARPYASFPHHSLHVFNAFSTMGTVPDSFANADGSDDQVGPLMDKCRISWGKVVNVNEEKLTVKSRPLIRHEGKLRLGRPTVGEIVGRVEGGGFVNDAAPGDWVSFHWGFACSTLTPVQVANLQKYTSSAMSLANKIPSPK